MKILFLFFSLLTIAEGQSTPLVGYVWKWNGARGVWAGDFKLDSLINAMGGKVAIYKTGSRYVLKRIYGTGGISVVDHGDSIEIVGSGAIGNFIGWKRSGGSIRTDTLILKDSLNAHTRSSGDTLVIWSTGIDSVTSSAGAGISVYKIGSKNVIKRLKAGSNITLTDGGDSVTIAATSPSAPGSNKQLIYNNSGTEAGMTDVEWTSGGQTLHMGTGSFKAAVNTGSTPQNDFDFANGTGTGFVTPRAAPTGGQAINGAVSQGDYASSTVKSKYDQVFPAASQGTILWMRTIEGSSGSLDATPMFQRMIGGSTLATSDATQSQLGAVALATGSTTTLTVYVTARAVTGTNTNFGAGYGFVGTYRVVSGNATVVGSVQSLFAPNEDNSAWDATFTTSGANVVISVTGEASTTINWSALVVKDVVK